MVKAHDPTRGVAHSSVKTLSRLNLLSEPSLAYFQNSDTLYCQNSMTRHFIIKNADSLYCRNRTHFIVGTLAHYYENSDSTLTLPLPSKLRIARGRRRVYRVANLLHLSTDANNSLNTPTAVSDRGGWWG